MSLTLSDFSNWRQDPVTKAFFQAALERVEDAKDILADTAGLDANQDNLLRGMILAYREMEQFRIDDLMEAQQSDH